MPYCAREVGDLVIADVEALQAVQIGSRGDAGQLIGGQVQGLKVGQGHHAGRDVLQQVVCQAQEPQFPQGTEHAVQLRLRQEAHLRYPRAPSPSTATKKRPHPHHPPSPPTRRAKTFGSLDCTNP